MIPETSQRRKINVYDRLASELLGIVRSGYHVNPVSPLECSLSSADDFHRTLQTFRHNDIYLIERRDPPQFGFKTQFQWGHESGYRTVQFELAQNQMSEFIKKHSANYKLPELK